MSIGQVPSGSIGAMSADRDYARRVRRLLSGELVAEEDPTRMSDADLRLLADTGQSAPVWRDGVYTADAEQICSDFEEWDRTVVQPLRPNAAFMDNTTLYTTLEVTTTRQVLTATALSDLGTFVNGVVLHDRILHLEHRSVPDEFFNDYFGDSPVRCLPVRTFDEARHGEYQFTYRRQDGTDAAFPRVHGIGALLAMTFKHAHKHAESLRRAQHPEAWGISRERASDLCQEVDALRIAWETVLGREVKFDDLVDDRELTSGWSSPTTDLLNELLMSQVQSAEMPFRFQHSLISESNRRAEFNERVATCLIQRPYLVGMLRRPFRDFRLRRAHLAQEALQDDAVKDVLDAIEDRPVGGLAEQRFQLPAFLLVCLERAATLEQFWQEVSRWRTKAEPLRSHIAELSATLSDRSRLPDRELKRLRYAVVEDAERLTSATGAAAAGSVAMIELLSGALEAALGLDGALRLVLPALAAGGSVRMTQGTLRRLVRRIREPELIVLAELGAAHRTAIQREELKAVGKLWNLDEDWLKRLEASYVRLGKLGGP